MGLFIKILFLDSDLYMLIKFCIFHTQDMIYCIVWLLAFAVRNFFLHHFKNISPL